MPEALVYDAIRTPRGRVRRTGGTLAEVPSYELFAGLLREFVRRGLQPGEVDDVLAGVSTVYGEQAGDLPRLAVMCAGWPDSVPGGTVSRMCTSGLDAIATGAAHIRAGMTQLVVAGGAESMSRVPMFADRPAFAIEDDLGERSGFVTIGVSADLTAARYGLTRDELDQWALRSHQRSAASPVWESVIPVTVDADVVLAADEGARADTTLESLAALAPLFTDDPLWDRVERRFPGFTRPAVGLHTVATAPQLCDGASAALIGGESAEAAVGHAPIGRIAGWARSAVRSPGLDGTVEAARRALAVAGIALEQVDVAEFNESFCVTPLVLIRELGIDSEKVNIRGGAVALGHPLGASGGIILANALELLGRTGGRYALLVIPAALGVSMAMVVERL
ncbi:thiolase family protein [Rudaeicoccus suwonensis]|uniref:Acetyl-CoA C-acetyltransferase n=1 Tax=Rudaeicoccus suwonensis TaxID=657409 RepID=A0A561DWZ5_9MICO|nr:acetyl-CoA C-acyltransferase [Rudaeicoccus suwonensis]TWE07895.1 acetyl-CoA C-acetyltransferase [Rudaeicoccus suwonensis]